MQATVIESLRRIDARLSEFFLHPAVAFNALLIVVLAAHGYEIFNLNITIDEELHIGHHGLMMAWFEQGRWGMGILSGLLPSNVVPVVSTGLGVGLLATSLWIIVVRIFGADRCAGFCAVSVAMTLPVLSFTMSFTTLAYGIGLGSLAAVGFIAWLRSEGLRPLLGAAIAGAFAISVYQPMLFALAALLIVEMCRTDAALSFQARLRGVWALLGAVVIYLTVDQIVRRLLVTDIQYVDQFLDLKGLIADPLDRVTDSARRVARIFGNSTRMFSLRSQSLAVFLSAALLVSAIPLKHVKGIARHAPLAAVLALIVLPVLADSLTPNGVPFRSSVYFLFVVGLIAVTAFRSAGTTARLGLIALALLAVLGNSVIGNRLYAAAGFAYERDRLIAHDIIREVARLTAADTVPRQLSLEVVGIKSWPESALIPKRETLGASFFEWEGGNRVRIAYFLNMFGLDIRGATDPERLPLIPISLQMPSWPADGWVRREQNMIIVRFGEYTPFQRQALCTAGAKEFCP